MRARNASQNSVAYPAAGSVIAPPASGPTLSPRKAVIRDQSEKNAAMRQAFRRRAAFFHEEDLRYLRFLIPEGLRILEIGCGAGDVLAALKPSYGVGVDFSPAMIAEAKRLYADLDFRIGDAEDLDFIASLPGPFDVILIVDTLGSSDDCQLAFETLHLHCTRSTRVVIAYYSHLWEPLLKSAEYVGWRAPQAPQNWMAPADIRNLAELAEFELIKSERRLLSPVSMLGVGRFLNRFVSILPGIRHLSLRHYTVCRSWRCARDGIRSASIIVPMRNERDNVESAIRKIPDFCEDQEIIFVEGNSNDGTYEEIERAIATTPARDIKLIRQLGWGKRMLCSPHSTGRAATC